MLARIASAMTVLATFALAATAQAVTVQRGSDLQLAPLAQAQGNDCAARWYPDTGGGAYQPFNSGQPSCSYYQGFVFGNANDPHTGFVPSDGVINTVTVRSGANPAPISFLILRQLTPAVLGVPAGSTECCFYVRETGLVRPQANATTTFTVNLPAENNRTQSVITQDVLGVSAVAGAGELPLAVIPAQFSFLAFTTPGTFTSGAYFPRLGALANDSGGGRREDNTYAGFELLVHYSFTPGPAVNPGRGPGLGPTAIATIGGAVLRPIGGALDATLNCLQVSCKGTIQLLTRAPVAAVAVSGGAKQIRLLASQKFRLRKGRNRKVHLTLNALGRKLSRQRSTDVKLVVDLGKPGKTSRNLTMVRAKQHG